MVNPTASWSEATSDPAARKAYSDFVTERDRELHAFIEFDASREPASAAGANGGPKPLAERKGSGGSQLAGMPFAVKDNIAVEAFHLTCGSKILGDLLSPYTATAVGKLQSAGALVVGKTNLDEFGMGSSTTNSAFGPSHNPWDLSRVAGGSSGGSAVAVAAGLAAFALGSDTGGSVRQPAGFCGVYGLKPTYGAVSRYGLVAYASSLECIGAISRSIDILEAVFDTMSGTDDLDQTTRVATSAATSNGSKLNAPPTNDDATNRSIAVLSGDLGLDGPTQRAFRRQIEILKGLGYVVTEVNLPLLEYVSAVYYTIATAEASANLARFNGIRYGRRPDFAENPDELVRLARSEGFGQEVKLRILLGTYVLRSGFQDQYYVRAQKLRTAIRIELDGVFTKAGALMTPIFPTVAFPLGDDGLSPFQQKIADRFASLANVAGVPSLSVPAGVEDGLPVGVQLLAPHDREDRLFGIARRIAEKVPCPQPPKFPIRWS